MRTVFFMALILLQSQVSWAADSNIDPSSLKLKVSKMAVSTSPLCTDLITVFSSSSPTEFDFLSGPSIASGTLADGTYGCIAFEMSDNIKFTPNATSDSGNCTAGTELTMDVCSSGSARLIDGTAVSCTSSEETVAIFLSTASSSSGNGFSVPTSIPDSSNGFQLGSSLVVSGSSSGKFIVNGTDKISDDGSTCDMAPPSFSFSQN